MRPTPVILWTGDEELITSAERIEQGRVDRHLLPLLKTTAVYRDLLLRDPEARQLVDPNQLEMVEKGYRCLTDRLMKTHDLAQALTTIAQIQLSLI